jgi:hypothetical protein
MGMGYPTDRRTILRGGIAWAGAALATASGAVCSQAQVRTVLPNGAELGDIRVIGKAPAVAARHFVALFTPNNGRIVHVHQSVAAAGAQLPGQHDIEESARATAQGFGYAAEKLRALHLPGFHDAGKRFRVDVRKQTLVELPPRRRPSPPRC